MITQNDVKHLKEGDIIFIKLNRAGKKMHSFDGWYCKIREIGSDRIIGTHRTDILPFLKGIKSGYENGITHFSEPVKIIKKTMEEVMQAAVLEAL